MLTKGSLIIVMLESSYHYKFNEVNYVYNRKCYHKYRGLYCVSTNNSDQYIAYIEMCIWY